MYREIDCLPCPCCGGHAQIKPGKQYIRLLQDWHSPEEAKYQPCSVTCMHCGLTMTRSACNADWGGYVGAQHKARELAVIAWNKRL